MTARVWLVCTGLAVGVVPGALALRYALENWSDHGDGELLAFAVGLAATGLAAAFLTARAGRELAGERQARR
jgi:hypothetical protein